MFIQLSDDRLLNLDRLVLAKINEIDDKDLKFVLNTNEVMIEKFDSFDAAEAALLLLQEDPFIVTEDDKLINSDYIKDVKISNVDDTKVEFVMFDIAPIKVKYEDSEAAKTALEEIINSLTEE